MTEEAVFAAMLERRTVAERATYLDEACAGDAALRRRVEALLQSHEEGGGFLETPAIRHAVEEIQGRPYPEVTQEESPGGGANTETLDFLDPPRRPGDLGRLGHYDVLEVIGRGGMGIVLKVFDAKLHRIVAIKVMAPQLATTAIARQRFQREAQAAAAVRNEHVIDIHAVEEAKGLPYLVMEYISGISLQERLNRGRPLELKEILRISMQTAAGLAAAHAQGLVHRDVKPANILLENGVERVKITDFGLARAADDASLTQSGVVAGTPQYMAPEQAHGKPVDRRADLFSLGSVLYAMCTGRAPFRASGTMAILKRVCEDTPRPIREINPDVPEWLAAVSGRLHEKNADDRFQTAAEVAELLGKYLAHLQQPALAPMPPMVEKSARAPAIGGKQGSHWRRWWAAAGLFLLIGAFSLTEAAGVTQVTSSVIRIFTPDGTLVVQVDDPEVKVTVEGDTGIVITDAGPQEVRLRPGSYRLQASKGGKPVKNELFTITRGGRQVVNVSLEKGPAVGEIRRFEGHTEHVWTVAFHPDGGRALSGGWDKTIRLWNLDTGKELRRFEGHTGGINSVVFSPDGRHALSGSGDKTLRLWDVETGKELRRFAGHKEGVWCVVFSTDGRRALSGGYGDRSGALRLWDVESGEELRCWETKFPVTGVAFSPDGRQALSCDRGSGELRLWDVETGAELRRLRGHTGGVEGVVFLPDGRRALSVGGQNDHTLRLWDVQTGEELRRFEGHTAWTSSVAVSPDGCRALSGGHDRTIRLWDVNSGKELHCLYGHTGGAQSVRFSPDGRRALSGSQTPDRTMRLWQLPEPEKKLVRSGGQ
jgi:WD40 repeat protein/tRNA A-37 threonylcarbamoyl transferase component Bud32